MSTQKPNTKDEANKPENKKETKVKMTRPDALCVALKTKKPKSMEEWIKYTNEIMGKANDSESRACILYAQKILPQF